MFLIFAFSIQKIANKQTSFYNRQSIFPPQQRLFPSVRYLLKVFFLIITIPGILKWTFTFVNVNKKNSFLLWPLHDVIKSNNFFYGTEKPTETTPFYFTSIQWSSIINEIRQNPFIDGSTRAVREATLTMSVIRIRDL